MNGLLTTDEVCAAFIAAGDSVADQSCIPRAVFWERLIEAVQEAYPVTGWDAPTVEADA